jgi:hypothetical protein
MPECRPVRHLVSLVPECSKLLMPETVRYRNKGARPGTGMLQYQTEVADAGMPIPAASPAKLRWSATLPNGFFLFTIKTKNAAEALFDCRLFINLFSHTLYFLEILTASIR